MTQPSIFHEINEVSRTEYNGHFNRATWTVELWIDNEPESYHAVSDYASAKTSDGAYVHTVEETTVYLIKRYGINGSEYPNTSLSAWLDRRQIFTQGTLDDLLGREMNVYRTAEALQRLASDRNLETTGMYGDLMTWGLAMLDYRGIADCTVKLEFPTYRQVLDAVLKTVNWREIAENHRDE